MGIAAPVASTISSGASSARGDARPVLRLHFTVRVLGLDADPRTSEPATKQQLRAATDAAIAAGVFGVPTVIADGELFWGVDSLPHLERFLAGHDPITAEDAAALASLAPSATRR